MGGYTQFKNITLCSFNLSTRQYDDVYPDYIIDTVNIPVSTGMEALWNKYKGYSISNKFVVGTWNYVGNQPQFTFNDNWNAVMRECGVRMSSLFFDILKTSTNVPSAARIEAQIFSLEPYIKGYYPTYTLATPSGHSNGFYWKYNNNKPYNASMPYISVSNFSAVIIVPIYDPVELQWYSVEATYRTDIGSNDMWLEFHKGNPQYPLPMSGVPIINPANPYPNIPDSEPGGGDGPGIGSSDVNPVPPVPSISAVGSGMCRLYNPNVSQLIDLGAWLWGNGLDLTQLKKIFTDPMDIILGCSIFPVAMPGETTEHIMFGNLDSEVSAKVVSSQYTTRDLGTIEIPETYNSYLDYSPYTKIQLYLPYIGMKQLNTDEVMGKTLGVVYSIDLLSGACVAHVYVESQLMYEFGGTCNTQIPLTARDYTATVQSLLGIVGGAITAGVAALALPEAIPAAAGAAGVIGGMAINTAKQTVGAKPTIEHASGIGGSTGIMASQHAYVIMEVPNLCHPPNQEHFTGYPGFIYGKVSDFEGYTKFINFEFIKIHATQPELEELRDWFMNKGVRI